MDDEIRFQDSKFRRPKFVHPGRRYRQISFDIDANYSDVSESCEDEVFVDEPRNSDKTSSKPLLQPKNRARSPSFKIKRKYYRLRRCLKLLCCVLTAVSSCLLILAVVLFAMQKSGINVLGGSLYYGSAGQEPTSAHTPEVLGCSDIQVEDVWIAGFPKLITESAFRLVDVNGDGTLDVLFGFGTGADGHNVPELVCDIYFNGTRPCFGGVLSIDGATGREL
ncbi:uncharacterized protein LOC106151284, partial [Lingula anatina]|uniref:Uncharacterized protein LOC106151284 n=1 Tax=Lingula anatina TaxID=7574 RepID=A0A1S3H358_LINAN